MKHGLFLGSAIVGEVIATSALKSSDGFSKRLPPLVVSGYCIALYFLSLALREIPVGVAYAIWAGLGVVLIACFAWIFHGQKLDLAAVAGLTLIIGGVIVMNVFSKVQAH